jgi:hypothetical protein
MKREYLRTANINHVIPIQMPWFKIGGKGGKGTNPTHLNHLTKSTLIPA